MSFVEPTETCEHTGTQVTLDADVLSELIAKARERDEMAAQLDQLKAGVREVHMPEAFHDAPEHSFCRACQRTSGVWPCPTIQVLNADGGA